MLSGSPTTALPRRIMSGKMKVRMRNRSILLRVTDEEYDRIEQRMKDAGVTNREAFIRRMVLNGYILRLDLPQMKELISQMRYMGNNLNQLTKRLNAGGAVYTDDLTDLRNRQEQLWQGINDLLTKMSTIQ